MAMLEPAEREEITQVLAAIPTVAGKPIERSEIKRIGGLTNRNYRITMGLDSYVLRLAGAGTADIANRLASPTTSAERLFICAPLQPQSCTMEFQSTSGNRSVRVAAAFNGIGNDRPNGFELRCMIAPFADRAVVQRLLDLRIARRRRHCGAFMRTFR